MSLRTMMQAGPAKANELFARLSETSDGAVRTREKLFAELKAELELHTELEEQHLFPVLRRNPETKALAADAAKDNRELRARLAELEALPKTDEAFPERLSELRKAFRQHARDERQELLPAVQRALSEEQAQDVAERIEAGRAEAGRRAGEAVQGAAEATARTVVAAERSVLRAAERVSEDAAAGARRAGEAALGVAEVGACGLRALAALPDAAADGAAEAHAAWVGWLGETALAAARTSQDVLWRTAEASQELLWQAAEGQRRLADDAVRTSQEILQRAAEGQRRLAVEAMSGWAERNVRLVRIATRVAGNGLRTLDAGAGAGSEARVADR